MKIKNNTPNLKNIKEQTPAICLAAVKQFGRDVRHVNKKIPNKIDLANPKHKRFYDLGWRDGDLDRVCMEAIKDNGLALQYVKEQTPAICMAAVQQNGFALEYVKDQTEDICLAAVKQTGLALRYVKEQTPEICLAAVQNNGHALQYVKDLHSIADEVDESIITEGLNSIDPHVVLAYQKLIKIREANAIAKRINDGLESTKTGRPKVKL